MADEGLLLYSYGGCLFRVPDHVQPPKAGSLLFDRNVRVRAGERVLEIGAGLGLTAELDGVKREGVPLQLDLDQLEDAKTSAGARAQLKEALRLYFRRVQGR